MSKIESHSIKNYLSYIVLFLFIVLALFLFKHAILGIVDGQINILTKDEILAVDGYAVFLGSLTSISLGSMLVLIVLYQYPLKYKRSIVNKGSCIAFFSGLVSYNACLVLAGLGI